LAAFLGLMIGAASILSTAVEGAPSGASKDGAARDWPIFGGSPQRNMVNTVDKEIPISWEIKEGKRQNSKWVMPLGTVAYGGPVVAGGKVFVGTNNEKPRNPKVKGDKGVVMCFRESDGAFLWQALHDKLPDMDENDWPQQGVASTPAVDGNRVYYVSNSCELICADTEGQQQDAKVVWRLDMFDKLKVFPHFLANGSPLVVGDLVYVVTGNGVDAKGNVPSPQAPSFLAVDKKTGAVVWQDNSPGAKILEGQWSNPTYAEVNGKGQIIVPGGDGWLRAFEAKSGALIWKFDCNPKNSVYKQGGRGTRNYFLATPVVYDNKVYIGVGQNPDNGPGVGHLWCIDITKTGDLSPVGDDFNPKSPVNKNSGLVWHYGGAAAPGGARDIVFGRTLSTCAIHDGLVYAAELEGFLHCLDAQTGAKYWDFDLKANVWGSPYWVDGKIYLGNDDGTMTIFAHGKTCKQLGSVEMDSPIKGTPVVANGVLYVTTGTHLYAIAKQ
jgi:outer membrane protein assembly factor BamB